jgi:PAS domain S-box-containing protein
MEANVQKILDALADGVIVVDETGVISFANKRSLTDFGYAYDELVGQPIETLVPEPEREPHGRTRKSFQAAPEARRMGLRRGLMGRRKDGSYFSVDISLSPMEIDGARSVLALVRDMSEPKDDED